MGSPLHSGLRMQPRCAGSRSFTIRLCRAPPASPRVPRQRAAQRPPLRHLAAVDCPRRDLLCVRTPSRGCTAAGVTPALEQHRS